MSRNSRRGLAAVALTLALLANAPAATTAQRRPASSDPQAVTVVSTTQSREDGFAGESRCQSCHKSELTQFHKTAHASVKSVNGTEAMNCESCHGPGEAHAAAQEAAHGDDVASASANRLIFAFKGTPQQNAARCLTCHVSSDRLQASTHSQHAATQVGCQSCHAAHLVTPAPSPPAAQAALFLVPRLPAEQRWLRESLLKDSQQALCLSCHQQVRTQFAQPFHHRVPEGSMKCTDCHSPHGTANRASLTAPAWDTCTSCHTDKHGPFVFEHAAVQVEGCAVCHTPHGATSRFLLQRRESRFLCLQCHGDTHSDQVSVPHSRLGFQTRGDCTRCHVAVHGSNTSPFFLQ